MRRATVRRRIHHTIIAVMGVKQNVGKLAEVRYREPLTVDEMTVFMADVRRLVDAAMEPLVFCCDWRPIHRFEPVIADTIVWIMRRDNPRIGANAVLVSEGRFFDDVRRILSQAGNLRRRVFTSESSLAAWLDPMLTPLERDRRRAFLAEP